MALKVGIVGFVLIALLTVLLAPVVQRVYPLLPDQGASWYYWKLPSPTVLSRLSAWLGYGLHQLTVWVLFWYFARKKDRSQRPTVTLMIVNLVFVAVHLVQTSLFYDGLAQDVPIWTSQGSVIVMLVLLLFLMIPTRGILWGKSFKPPQTLYKFVQRWHGPYIAWALIYTFWFHPMDGNWGLMSGFIYMFLLFIQLSIPRTSLHTKGWWIVVLEVFVAVHGTLITVYKDNPIWPMFLFGFVVMFVFTQQFSIKAPGWVRLAVVGTFLVAAVFVYAFIRGFDHVYEILFIPVALYGGVVGLLLVGYLVEWIRSRIGRGATDLHP